jgi:cation transport ATPase
MNILTGFTPKEIAKAIEALKRKNAHRNVREWMAKHPEEAAVIKEKNENQNNYRPV